MNEIYLNEEEIIKIIEKLDLELNEEKLNFDNIKNSLNSLNLHYKTNNKTKLDDLAFTLTNKLTKILKIHDNNIIVLRKKLDTYITTKNKVSKLFDDIV